MRLWFLWLEKDEDHGWLLLHRIRFETRYRRSIGLTRGAWVVLWRA